MHYKIDECMKRFAYFSHWGLFMLYKIDECMHRFAYFPFRWLLMLHGAQFCDISIVKQVSPSHDISHITCAYSEFAGATALPRQ